MPNAKLPPPLPPTKRSPPAPVLAWEVTPLDTVRIRELIRAIEIRLDPLVTCEGISHPRPILRAELGPALGTTRSYLTARRRGGRLRLIVQTLRTDREGRRLDLGTVALERAPVHLQRAATAVLPEFVGRVAEPSKRPAIPTAPAHEPSPPWIWLRYQLDRALTSLGPRRPTRASA